MKRLIIFFALCLCAVTFFVCRFGQAYQTDSGKQTTAKIYCIDRRLHRLIPTDRSLRSKNVQKKAEEVIDMLYSDTSSETLQLIQKSGVSLAVSVSKNTAFVDICGQASIPKNFDDERLFVYQIVNSLTSLPEIDKVQFTINGKTSRSFVGFLDMREIFTPDYFI